MNSPPQLAHVSTTFRFQLAAPLARVAPLFGPEGERCWAGKDWDPHFLYPQRQLGRRFHRPARPPHQLLGQHRV
jgi:hypothetical protein